MSSETARDTLDIFIAKRRKELQGFYEQMKQFENQPPIDTIRDIAQMQARVYEIRNQIIRSKHDMANRFRIDEIDPFLEASKRQFEMWSRVGSLTEMEWRMTGAGL